MSATFCEQADPGVVDEHVEAAEAIDRLAHGRTDLRRIPDIGDRGERARTQLCRTPFEFPATSSGDHDRARPPTTSALAIAEPDSLRPARDQRDCSIERQRLESS